MSNEQTDMIFISQILHAASRLDCRSVLTCLLHFKQNLPHRCDELDDPHSSVGASCVNALSIAVENNDKRSMIALFTKRRAKQVLKNPILKSPVHSNGLSFLKTLAAMNNDPTSGFSENLRVLHATPYPGNGKQWELENPLNAALRNVKELSVVHAQKKMIVRAIESPVEPIVSIKRKM